jgi:hypothetical protein
MAWRGLRIIAQRADVASAFEQQLDDVGAECHSITEQGIADWDVGLDQCHNYRRVSVSNRNIDWRVATTIEQCEVGVARDEETNHIDTAITSCKMSDCVAIFINAVDLCASVQRGNDLVQIATRCSTPKILIQILRKRE